jgi:hypothetical protein
MSARLVVIQKSVNRMRPCLKCRQQGLNWSSNIDGRFIGNYTRYIHVGLGTVPTLSGHCRPQPLRNVRTYQQHTHCRNYRARSLSGSSTQVIRQSQRAIPCHSDTQSLTDGTGRSPLRHSLTRRTVTHSRLSVIYSVTPLSVSHLLTPHSFRHPLSYDCPLAQKMELI